MLLDVLWLCCTQGGQQLHLQPDVMDTDHPGSGTVSVAMARHLGLLLIELVAPDVIYNGTPWPEEEFMRVTTER